jgi:N-acetyl sugar amidotransferase
MTSLEVCSRCVMDSTAQGFYYTQTGCNFCDDYQKKLDSFSSVSLQGQKAEESLSKLALEIKSRSVPESKFDCIVGLSGGLDSVYSLHLAVKAGLRVLAVHMDNGWNSNLAQVNIENLISKTSVQLLTKVISWPEYRDLQKAFMAADVLDIEMIYDQAVFGTLFEAATKNKVKTIIAGTNQATEGFAMPLNYSYSNKLDVSNLLDIWKQFGSGRKISTYPFYSTFENMYDMYWKKIKWVSILDSIDYSKDHAIETLKNEYGFVPYPYKHYESFFTKFYQGFILPVKFGVDKRKVHLSNLIMTGSITREQGLMALTQNPFLTEATSEEDIAYFLKKMNYTAEEFKCYLERPAVEHSIFASDRNYIEKYRQLYFFANSIFFRLKRVSIDLPLLFFGKKPTGSSARLTSSIEQRGAVKHIGAILFIVLTIHRRRALQKRTARLAGSSID